MSLSKEENRKTSEVTLEELTFDDIKAIEEMFPDGCRTCGLPVRLHVISDPANPQRSPCECRALDNLVIEDQPGDYIYELVINPSSPPCPVSCPVRTPPLPGKLADEMQLERQLLISRRFYLDYSEKLNLIHLKSIFLSLQPDDGTPLITDPRLRNRITKLQHAMELGSRRHSSLRRLCGRFSCTLSLLMTAKRPIRLREAQEDRDSRTATQAALFDQLCKIEDVITEAIISL